MGRRKKERQVAPIVRTDLRDTNRVWAELSNLDTGGQLTIREDELLPEVLAALKGDARFVRLESKVKDWSAVWTIVNEFSLPHTPQLRALWDNVQMAGMPRVHKTRPGGCDVKKSKKPRPVVISCNTHLVQDSTKVQQEACFLKEEEY